MSVGARDPDDVFGGNARFELRGRLGVGSMGVVYEAFDRLRGEPVALKVLRTLSADAILRLKREFRALADLHDPSFVQLRELFEEGGRFFFSMELVQGEDFLTHVRGGERVEDGSEDEVDDEPTAMGRAVDEGRLRLAFGALARAIAALHDAGHIHRDLKPSNVRVTPEGRVVLLDFGLATPHGAEASATEGDIVGTPFYMAPEQAAGQSVGPAVDWYAFGVMLYEALTGGLPYEGGALSVLLQKQRDVPRPPRAIVPHVPADLDDLCVRLLSIEAALRPQAPEILRRLEAGRPGIDHTTPSSTPTFIGRGAELAALGDALAASRAGRSVLVAVRGESGVGKTALVRRFTQEALVREPALVVLHGRCHEREAVPYKALDGVIDALARFLSRADGAEVAALMPLEASLLGAPFPVLRRVRAVAQAPARSREIVDPGEARRRAFLALRELFLRLCARRPVVVVIDDLHWADGEGLGLWSSILRGPDGPPLLFIATLRDDVAMTDDARAAFDEARAAVGEARALILEGLPPDDARLLAARLLGRAMAGGGAMVTARTPEDIAREAAGHPLFIDALVRHVALAGAPLGPLRLDDALWARIRELDDDSRALLEIAALHGSPLSLQVAGRALGLSPTAVSRGLSVLRLTRLVRPAGAGDAAALEVAHDRVRAALLERTPAETQRARHESLALALEATPHADPEAKAQHWYGAGAREKAAAYALAAGEAAAKSLAFERAARLFAWALEIGGRGEGEIRATRAALARALANAGRGRAAAALFEQAAEGAASGESLDLRRLAAEQYLRSGHFDDGLRVSRGLLLALGVPFPETPSAAVRGIVLRRAELRLRGLGFRRREAGELPQAVLRRVDVFWSMATTLGLVDPVRGAYFNARHLLAALSSGEPGRVVRALGLEAAYVAQAGTHSAERSAAILARVERLAKELDTPYTSAWWLLATGAVALLEGRFADCLAAVEPAEAILRDRCVGTAWELATAQWFGLWSHACRGELETLRRRAAEGLRDAESRGDVFGMACHETGFANLAWLARGEVEEARARVAASAARASRWGFQAQHWWQTFARIHIALYEGGSALEIIDGAWKPLQASKLTRLQLTRVEAFYLRGRARVQAAFGAKGAAPRRELAEAALRDRASLGQQGPVFASAFGALVEGGARLAVGDDEGAMRALELGERQSEAAGMALAAAAARRLRGALLGGDGGRALRERGDAQMRAEGVVDPARMTELWVPNGGRG